MDILRIVGAVILAILAVAIAFKVLAFLTWIFTALISLLFFAAVIFVVFLIARSALGHRGRALR